MLFKQCILCGSSKLLALRGDSDRKLYHHCGECDLRFLDAIHRLNPEEEMSRYRLHQNDIHDVRYQEFVEPLAKAIEDRFVTGSRGLDFGSGYAPVLSHVLQGRGFCVDQFDAFFMPHLEALDRKYDFVCAAEVVEHFHEPAKEFRQFRSLLNVNGLVGIMTLLVDEATDFASWYYRRDPTHVTFYSRKTFQYIAHHFGFAEVQVLSERLIVLSTLQAF